MAVNLGGSIALDGQITIRDYVLPAPAPEVKLDDTWWEDNGSGFMSWNGSQWNYNFFNGGNTGLNVIDSGGNDGWEVGYTPASADVTFNSGGSWTPPLDFITTFYDGQAGVGNVIGTAVTSFTATSTNYTINIPLDFGATGDIRGFQFGFGTGAGDDSWYCSNIQFNL